MSQHYFRKVPNFQYTSRKYEDKTLSDYTTVKNLFKRAKLRDDIFENVAFFERYNIIGDERPDNVAYKIYGDSTLDWLVLLANNILDIQSEWPLPASGIEKYYLNKYGSYEKLYEIHHYETIEVRDSLGNLILPSGVTVPKLIKDHRRYIKVETNDALNSNYEKLVPYFVEFYDYGLDQQVFKTNIINEVTNYVYELNNEEKKRHIFILKPDYLNVVLDDLDNIMTYKKGSSQYISNNTKRGDNIRL